MNSDERHINNSRLYVSQGTADIRPDANALLNQAMHMLARQPNVIFIGQNVAYDGNVVYRHLEGVPMNQRYEMPVAEELQMGIATGLALRGFLPISIYPRIDFLILAMNQLVNHLDKLEQMSSGQYLPKVIIRTRVGSKWPLDAGPQHTQNHASALRRMLTNIAVVEITTPDVILSAYEEVLERSNSSLIIEHLD